MKWLHICGCLHKYVNWKWSLKIEWDLARLMWRTVKFLSGCSNYVFVIDTCRWHQIYLLSKGNALGFFRVECLQKNGAGSVN